MQTKAITTLISDKSDEVFNPDIDTVIDVENVVMDFNSANQQLNSFKEYFIAAAKRELMFKRFRALDNISLKVQRGDVYGILGTNGSGKSTLLKIVSGVLEPTDGTVRINGRIAPLIEMGAGFDYELTARENIYLNGALLGYSKEFIERHFDAIVDFAEIRNFLDMPLKNYSSGMVSRIAFAIATVIVPEILIVDEVLAVGDFMFRQKCERRIESLIQDNGTTVLIVSHSSEQIERLCNKAIWIEKGHMRMIGPAHEVSQMYQAVGGHTGSPSSEETICHLLNSPLVPDTAKIENIAGSDRFATNNLVASKLFAKQPTNTIVLAPGKDVDALLQALNLSEAIDGLMLMTDTEDIPDATLSTLASMNPERVYLIRHPESHTIASKVRASVDKDCKLVEIPYETQGELGKHLALLKMEKTALSDDTSNDPRAMAIVAGSKHGAAIATLAPLIAQGALFLPLSSDNDDTLEILRAQKPEEIVALGDDDEIAQMTEYLRGLETLVTPLRDETSDASNEEALNLLARISQEKHPCDTVYITTQEAVVDAISIAPLVLRDEGVILTIDHNDMNSMIRAINYLTTHGDQIERIVVLGSNMCFTNVDKTLFGKALAQAQITP